MQLIMKKLRSLFYMIKVGSIFVKLFILVIINTFLFISSIHSQVADYKFNHIDFDDGLSNLNVSCFVKDELGFIWIGTEDGLNRFDGKNLKVYRHNEKNGNSISDNNIFALLATENYIWIGNEGSGIDRYNLQTEEFENFNVTNEDETIKLKNVNALSELENKNVLIGADNGLFIFDNKEEKLKSYFEGEAKKFFSEIRINSILNDNDKIWLGTNSDVFCIIKENKEFFHFQSLLAIEEWGNWVQDISIGPDNNFYILKQNWLFVIDRSYIPGFRYTNEDAEWAVVPGLLQPDLNVSTILMPGEVFAIGDVPNTGSPNYIDQLDIEFKNNPWGADQSGTNRNAVDNWGEGTLWLFKILNDSITRGLKAPGDINDFELIDTYVIDRGWQKSWRRLPEIWKGNPVLKASQDEEDMENFEWDIKDPSDFNGNSNSVPSNIGQHFFVPPTHYMSTVSSVVYKVSEGYSMNESIRGMTTGTTVADFMSNLIKKNENQVLNVHGLENGTELSMDAVLGRNDTLVVMSADSVNITRYVLDVSEEGLSSDALLTSDRYVITVDSEPKSAGTAAEAGEGTITGFEYGTQLNTLLNNIDVPAGASLSVINGEGAYVPLKALNFDTLYVWTTVNANIYFDALAEDGVTRIIYQLQPQSSESQAIVLSDVYSVLQRNLLIEYVPGGTNVSSFLANLTPSLGATMKVVDKMGNERLEGTVADDDKLIVTSADGKGQTTYYISKLATKYVKESKYLAYITSNIYKVDQLDYKVYNVSGSISISDLYSRIDVADGATAIIIDENGVEKTTGNIAKTDKVKVTSADGKTVVMYTFETLTGANSLNKQQLTVYPNPTNDKLSISGLEPGERIQIFNSTGRIMNEIQVKQNIETVSLADYASGVYFVIIVNNNVVIGKEKVIKF